ncbi:hypothetical protein N2152v2_006743 [Parachlorella kessleri]
MATLVTRPGDPQALKAAAAAALTGAALSIVALDDSGSRKKLLSDGNAPFDQAQLLLILPDGTGLYEPNATARFLAADSGSSLSTECWVEWEEQHLRPAAYSGDAAALQAAVEKLAEGLAGRRHLVGNQLSLADCVVYATLRPLQGSEALAPLAAYLEALSQEQPLAAAEQQILLGKPAETLRSVLLADSAACKAQKPKLPIPGQRNILITSALPYVNNVPHLGNIIGCVLSADVYARFCRARGYNTVYVCGTDEYGTATETKALEEGLSCQEICDKYHAIHKAIYEWFDISFDKFGRTPTRAQTEIGQDTFRTLQANGFLDIFRTLQANGFLDIFRTLQANGFLVEQTMEQLYSEPINKFLADRFVSGTCPKCKYEDARGDQCDNCGALLNPTELINPKCKITGTTPVVRQTKHIFLDLPKLSDDLQKYIDTTSQLGGWSSNCVQASRARDLWHISTVGVTNAWMAQGLKVRCITRDLKWGTPVPLEGYEDKAKQWCLGAAPGQGTGVCMPALQPLVFYVWFDAPIGYISITANYCHDWEAWWKNPKDVELVQFMGKDNVPFHTVIFPASLLGTRQPWTLMKSISVTEYLNYEDGKFSKSRGVGVFGNDAKETGIPVEVWRYYLLAMRPENQDTVFVWDDFAAKVNAELNNNLGNFIQRTVKFLHSRFDRTVPGPAGDKGAEAVKALGEKVAPLVQQYITALENQKMREALKCAMLVSSAGNLFFQDQRLWVLVKTDKEACGACISACAGIMALMAALLQPFMPSFTTKALGQLGLSEALPLTDDLIARAASPATLVPPGHQVAAAEPKPIFDKVTDEQVAQLRSRYAGSQADRSAQQAASSASTAAAPGAAGKDGKKAAAAAAAAAAGGKKEGKKDGSSKAAKGAPPPAAAAASSNSTEGGGGSSSSKKQDKKAAKGGVKPDGANSSSNSTAGGSSPAAAAAAAAEGGKKGGSGEDGAAAGADVSRVDLRVGLIRKAWRHPDAESLYVEEVDVGEPEPRTVVSGLVKFIPEEAMQQRRVVLVCNLKPANMRGVKSQAMVLAATSTDGGSVELVEPPHGAAVGERVFVEGFPGEPDEVLNPKKKIWEAVQPDLATNEQRVACYRGKPLQTAQGICTVQSIVGGSIK